MPDNQNLTQNPIPEENSSPVSPQEPMVDAPVSATDSVTSEVPPEAPEASRDDFEVKSSDIPPLNSTPETTENKVEIEEIESKPETTTENQAEVPTPTSFIPTAQIPANEPFESETEIKPEPLKTEPVSVIIPPKNNSIHELLAKAKNAIQFRKRKKLDKIMTLFLKQSKITNDEVEKFLHVSDATATRYLSQLEQEGKIKQNGKTGHVVFYSKI
jgi:hypothetical protein